VGLGDELLSDRVDITDQQLVVDGFERWLVGEWDIDQHGAVHDPLPAPETRRELCQIARMLGKAHPLLAAVGDVGETVDRDVRSRQWRILGGRTRRRCRHTVRPANAAPPTRRRRPR
jgi:hypothetical protein